MAECIDCRDEGRQRVAHYKDPNLCFDCRQKRKGIVAPEALKKEDFTELGEQPVSQNVLDTEKDFLKTARKVPEEMVSIFSSEELIGLGFEKTSLNGWVRKYVCATENCLERRSSLDCKGVCKKCKIEQGILPEAASIKTQKPPTKRARANLHTLMGTEGASEKAEKSEQRALSQVPASLLWEIESLLSLVIEISTVTERAESFGILWKEADASTRMEVAKQILRTRKEREAETKAEKAEQASTSYPTTVLDA